MEPPRWHFERLDHGQGDMTLTDVWGRSDGAVFVVGWYGTIFTNRVTEANPEGLWRVMASHTTEHLTGIWGVENGNQFNQNRQDGEMFAVGWNGTLLHYHPNPTGATAPQPEDGQWQVISGPSAGFVPKVKIDPYCPDFDGDGIPDDGGGDATSGQPDGWWSLADTCRGGATNSCDDNCRTSPNGSQRPVVDLDGDFVTNPCLEDGDDGPDPAHNPPQDDPDQDGIGTVCDSDQQTTLDSFKPTLFDVWAQMSGPNNSELMVLAVGENGALVTYHGPNASVAPTGTQLPVTDSRAWIAQKNLPYRFSNDCFFLDPGTPAGMVCAGAGRLPTSCSAQCNPYKTTCSCPVDQNQCCVSGTGSRYTGAPCDGPTCGGRQGASADNACNTNPSLPGSCSTLCPNCFRSLEKTLKSIISDGTTAIAVGASATVVTLDMGNPDGLSGVWVEPDCAPDVPPPLDELPLLNGVSTRDGGYQIVGVAGTVVGYPDGGGCGLAPRCGAAPVFLSGVYGTGARRGYAVGDVGTLLEFNGTSTDCVNNPPVTEIETEIDENLYAIWVTYAGGVVRLWLVGATGTLVKAGYF